MISRIWHGWTSPSNADAYESLLNDRRGRSCYIAILTTATDGVNMSVARIVARDRTYPGPDGPW